MFVRPSPRALRTLVAGGLVLGISLVPSTAWADDGSPTDPLGGVTGLVDDVVGGVTGGPEEAPPDEGTAEEQPTPTGPEDGGAPPLDPAQLDALIAELGAQGPFPEGCAEGVQAAIEALVAELTALPPPPDQATLEQFVGDLQSGLGDLQGGTPPALPDPTDYGFPDLAGAVQDLVAALQACLVAPDAPETPQGPAPSPPSDGGTPAGHVPPPAPGPQVAPAPVVYPGYAPTGAVRPAGRPVDTGAPGIVGAALLLTAAGHRMRTRAARGEG